MKFAITVSAYLMDDFVRLNLEMCQRVFPGSPVLVSDDKSHRSDEIEKAAHQYGASYICSNKRRGHFCADVQSWANALAFGESVRSDVSIKISFRLILLDPTLRTDFEDLFSNSICDMAVPQKIRPEQLRRRESHTFAMVPCLSDVILMRTGVMSPTELINYYRHKIQNERAPHSSLVESLAYDLLMGKFKDRSKMLESLSFHYPGQPHRYLRKCQNHQIQYVDLARKLGLLGAWDVREWSHIERGSYRPKPVLV